MPGLPTHCWFVGEMGASDGLCRKSDGDDDEFIKYIQLPDVVANRRQIARVRSEKLSCAPP